MNWLLILISSILIPAFAGAAELLDARAETLLGHIAKQDGPNCFNTSLYLQGFTQDLVYTSQTELDFYLENFCQTKPATSQLEARDLVTFVSPEDQKQITHTVVSINENLIVEKSSLAGSQNPANPEDPQPGQYLKHDISMSIYSASSSQELFGSLFKQKAFRCQSENQVSKTLATAKNNPAIKEQLSLRTELAKAATITDRKELENKIINFFTPRIASLRWDKTLSTNSLEIRYLHALLRSNAYQMYLLNCSESLKKFGECSAPQLKESIANTDAWFSKIYTFEKKHNLNQY